MNVSGAKFESVLNLIYCCLLPDEYVLFLGSLDRRFEYKFKTVVAKSLHKIFSLVLLAQWFPTRSVRHHCTGCVITADASSVPLAIYCCFE